MAGTAPRIFISAGEPSGDQHAARVAAALLRRWPDATIDVFCSQTLGTVHLILDVNGYFE